MNRLRSEQNSLRDALLKVQNLNDTIGQDKHSLTDTIKQVAIFFYSHGNTPPPIPTPQSCNSLLTIFAYLMQLEAGRALLAAEKVELNKELTLLKEEHAKLEESRMDLEATKLNLEEQLHLASVDKEKVLSAEVPLFTSSQNEHHHDP